MAKPMKKQPIDKGKVWIVFVGGAAILYCTTLLVEDRSGWFPAITKANSYLKMRSKQIEVSMYVYARMLYSRDYRGHNARPRQTCQCMCCCAVCIRRACAIGPVCKYAARQGICSAALHVPRTSTCKMTTNRHMRIAFVTDPCTSTSRCSFACTYILIYSASRMHTALHTQGNQSCTPSPINHAHAQLSIPFRLRSVVPLRSAWSGKRCNATRMCLRMD